MVDKDKINKHPCGDNYLNGRKLKIEMQMDIGG